MSNRLRNRSAVLALALLPGGLLQAQTAGNVSATRHNLTASGPGPIRVAGSKGVCLFCHTPHSASPIGPLWNRADPGSYYQTYESSTLVASVGQPSGSSRLCLSCHDGTIALAQTINPRGSSGGTVYITAADRGYIGTDLSDDHPISFVYDSGLAARRGGLADPGSLPKALRLDDNHQLQCTTCHDPHDDSRGKFLTMHNTESQMCRTCHLISGWGTSSHATATASLAASTRDRWENLSASTVREAACEGCHRPHTAGGRQRLLRHEAEEDNCLSCHDGSVASSNIAAQLGRTSAHPVAETTGVHDPTERPFSMPAHVECVDCHNPHRVSGGGQAQAPTIQPAMAGVSGVTGSGTIVAPAAYEYQVCYKCHAGSNPVRLPLVDRVLVNTNVAEEFAPTGPSYHPVEAIGKNRNVPSLLQPWQTTSRLYCTDCHSSSGSGAPRGPHGSSYRPLLVRNYETDDFTSESSAAYALCYGCHNRASILGDESFEKHKKHIVDKKTPCSVCHDPHGISAAQGSPTGNTHLINFDVNVVKPSKKLGTGPFFEDRGTFRGSCTLQCHGKDHDDKDYKP